MDVVSVIYMPAKAGTAAESLIYYMFCGLIEIGLINVMKVEDEKKFLEYAHGLNLFFSSRTEQRISCGKKKTLKK